MELTLNLRSKISDGSAIVLDIYTHIRKRGIVERGKGIERLGTKLRCAVTSKESILEV